MYRGSSKRNMMQWSKDASLPGDDPAQGGPIIAFIHPAIRTQQYTQSRAQAALL